MVEIKRALRVDVVVPPVAKRVVLADEHLGAAAWELGCGELLLVVLLKRGRELVLDRVVAEDRLDCFGDVGELCWLLAGVVTGAARGRLPKGGNVPHPAARCR